MAENSSESLTQQKEEWSPLHGGPSAYRGSILMGEEAEIESLAVAQATLGEQEDEKTGEEAPGEKAEEEFLCGGRQRPVVLIQCHVRLALKSGSRVIKLS